MGTKVNTKKKDSKKDSTEEKTNNSVFADGVGVFPPHNKAPEFIKGTVTIQINKLSEWCSQNEDKLKDYKGEPQLTLVLKESKDGKLYASVDTYGTEFAKENEAK